MGERNRVADARKELREAIADFDANAGAIPVMRLVNAIEDLIDPRETRPYLCQFIEALQPRLRTQLGPKYKTGVRP